MTFINYGTIMTFFHENHSHHLSVQVPSERKPALFVKNNLYYLSKQSVYLICHRITSSLTYIFHYLIFPLLYIKSAYTSNGCLVDTIFFSIRCFHETLTNVNFSWKNKQKTKSNIRQIYHQECSLKRHFTIALGFKLVKDDTELKNYKEKKYFKVSDSSTKKCRVYAKRKVKQFNSLVPGVHYKVTHT